MTGDCRNIAVIAGEDLTSEMRTSAVYFPFMPAWMFTALKGDLNTRNSHTVQNTSKEGTAINDCFLFIYYDEYFDRLNSCTGQPSTYVWNLVTWSWFSPLSGLKAAIHSFLKRVCLMRRGPVALGSPRSVR